MKEPPHMVVAVLDVSTSEMLRALTVHEVEFCTHVTMAYNPTAEVFARYEHLIGRTIEFDILSSFMDGKAQAATVKGVPSEKAAPHITMGCALGVPPVYSDEMLRNPRRETPLKLRGKATIRRIG